VLPKLPEAPAPPPPPVANHSFEFPNLPKPALPGFEQTQDDEQKKKLEALKDAVNPKEAVIPGKPLPEPVLPALPKPSVVELPTLPDSPMTKKDNEPPPPAVVTLPPAPNEVVPKSSEVSPALPAIPMPGAPAPTNTAPMLPTLTDNNAQPKLPDVSALPMIPKENSSPLPNPAAIKPLEPKLPPIVNSNPPREQGHKELTNPSLPPLGADNKFHVPGVPIGGKPNGTLPQVKDYNIVTHFCQPDDLSFEAVSKRHFRTEKYAKALHQFNRKHPLAKENVQADNPRLVAGQAVFIPPAELLESHYPQLIGRDLPSLPAVPGIGVNPSVPPAVADRASQVPLAKPAVVPSTDATKRYRVGGNGQMLVEIAQQTLGDQRRWSEIYRLNPTIRPEFPIPAGTELRLPANANVP
jgi:hypothetical protein